MTDTKPELPLALVPTDITRFNALRHGVLSRYTVLPWECATVRLHIEASRRGACAPPVTHHPLTGERGDKSLRSIGRDACAWMNFNGREIHDPLFRGGRWV